MNHTCRSVSTVLVALTIVVGSTSIAADRPTHSPNPPEGHASVGPWQITGKVAQTMDVGSYTYLQVDDGKQKVWAAAPSVEVAVGDHVKVPEGTLMTEYHSKTLDRTFERIHFVAFVEVERAASNTKQAHAKPAPTVSSGIDLTGIDKADGGVTVAQVFDDRAVWKGKEITLRGKVVKFSPRIMGTNWIHLSDGTNGADTENDLTVTTAATVNVGDMVLVRGVVVLNKDFGYGYKYDVIIENADVSVEHP